MAPMPRALLCAVSRWSCMWCVSSPRRKNVQSGRGTSAFRSRARRPVALNAITDVAGVEVGMTTLISGEGKLVEGTGSDSNRRDRNPAARPHVRSGVCRAPRPERQRRYDRDALGAGVRFSRDADSDHQHRQRRRGPRRGARLDESKHKYFSPLIAHVWFAYPLVGETYDGMLNDMYGFHVKPEHVARRARFGEARPRGRRQHRRRHRDELSRLQVRHRHRVAARGHRGPTTNTVGVLVQANFGGRDRLTIAGVQVGAEIKGVEIENQLRRRRGAGGRRARLDHRRLPPRTRRWRHTSCGAWHNASRLVSAAPAARPATDRATSSSRFRPPTLAPSAVAARAPFR